MPLEIVVSVAQLFGAILFMGSEVWWGGIHIPVDWKLQFTFNHLLYFWFGFLIANTIWLVIPTYIIVSDVCSLTALIREAAESTSRKSTSYTVTTTSFSSSDGVHAPKSSTSTTEVYSSSMKGFPDEKITFMINSNDKMRIPSPAEDTFAAAPATRVSRRSAAAAAPASPFSSSSSSSSSFSSSFSGSTPTRASSRGRSSK